MSWVGGERGGGHYMKKGLQVTGRIKNNLRNKRSSKSARKVFFKLEKKKALKEPHSWEQLHKGSKHMNRKTILSLIYTHAAERNPHKRSENKEETKESGETKKFFV